MTKSWYVVFGISVLALALAFDALFIAVANSSPEMKQLSHRLYPYTSAMLPYIAATWVLIILALVWQKISEKRRP